MPTVADLVIDRLRGAGVRALFGVPGGGSNLDLVEAAARAGLRFVLTSTETAAALAAVGQAEVTGRPAACLTTLGPGATSVVNGVACAWLDRAPLVVFTDSHPSAAAGCEHQRVDHAALFAPITNWSTTLDAASAGASITAALGRAAGPRPGPVHVDCPGDAAGTALDAFDRSAPCPPEEPSVAEEEMAKVERLLAVARKPLLLVGLGARGIDDALAIRTFCERHRIPALVTYKAKGIVPDDHPMFAGVLTNARIESVALDESDLLIGVGLDPVELIPREWTHRQPIAYCGRWPVDEGHVRFAVQAVGSIAGLLRAVEPAVHSDWDEVAASRLADAQRATVVEGAGPMSPQRAMLVAADAAGAARVVVDAGAHMFPATMLWPIREPNGMLISNGLSTMAFALPAGIGAALADPDRRLVVVSGDGGLLMCAGELLTAARERLRITVVVFSDDSLSLIEIKQQARRLLPSGVALGGVRWPALADSVGVAGFCARTETELARAIEATQAIDGPSLVEAKIDRRGYPAILKAIRG